MKLREKLNDDEFCISLYGLKTLTTIPINKITTNSLLPYGLILVSKIRRLHWWQFWKPKYIGAIFRTERA